MSSDLEYCEPKIHYTHYICRTHIEGQSLIEGRFPHRGPNSSQIEGRFVFPTSRAKVVIYARSVVFFRVTLLAGDQWLPFFVTFLFPVTDILCLLIQYFGKIN